jgi:hypothetical protein
MASFPSPDLPDNSHLPRGSAALPMPPLHLINPSPSKRRRQATFSKSNRAPTAPPSLRPPPIRNSNAFLFKEPHPLYSRHIITDPAFYNKMTIRCTQPDCTYSKVIKRTLSGTNNHKTHYHNAHKGIATSAEEAAQQTAIRIEAQGGARPFFAASAKAPDHNSRYRRLVMNLILKNNLSFSTIDQPEFNDLITCLSPQTANLSRRVLMRDL